LIRQKAMHGLLRNLRRLAAREDRSITDSQLLDEFLRARDEGAFEELVRRHGPMVLGVCRRVLVNADDADDAFQATFLVLVRKASSIIKRDTVANWLYGVALRTAQKARVLAARRRHKERMMARPEAIREDVGRDWRPLFDKELNGLPAKYREPILLCDVEGHTRKQAAKLLRCPEGTVSVRLSRGRQMLAQRLTQRGWTVAGSVGAVALLQQSVRAVSAPLVSSTVKAAALVVAGHAVADTASASVAAITEGVLKAMFRSKLKFGTALAVAVGAIAIGFGLYQTRATAGGDGTVFVKAPLPEKAEEKKEQDKFILPTGPAPVQVLASLDKDSKLVIKTMSLRVAGPNGGGGAEKGGAPGAGGFAPAPKVRDTLPPGGNDFVPVPPGAGGKLPPGGTNVVPQGSGVGPKAPPEKGDFVPGSAAPAKVGKFPADTPIKDNDPAPGAQPGKGETPGDPVQTAPPPVNRFGGGGGAFFQAAAPARGGKMMPVIVETIYDLDEVKVFDTKGKEIDTDLELPKLLKQEVVAMASFTGQPVDPLHLRVLKEGTLTFILPPTRHQGGFGNVPGMAPGQPGGVGNEFPRSTTPAPGPNRDALPGQPGGGGQTRPGTAPGGGIGTPGDPGKP